MFSESYSFPHPVLGLGDDIKGSFQVFLKIERNSQERKVRFYDIDYKIDNNYIKTLIDTGKAGVLFKIYCSSTFKTWTISDPLNSFQLDENDLYNKIEIEIFLITKEKISNFIDSSFNPQYSSFPFSLDEREIIGISGKVIMQIEKNDEKLGLGNIFKFFSHDQEKPIEFTYTQDKIHILYPKDGENHPPNALFKIYPWTAFNLFIVPALTGAFEFVENAPSEVEGLEWFIMLTNVLPQDDWDPDPYANAQLFLKDKLSILKAYKELTQ